MSTTDDVTPSVATEQQTRSIEERNLGKSRLSIFSHLRQTSNMRLRTRKLLTPELVSTDNAQSTGDELNEAHENTPAGETQENSSGSMNRDSQVVCAALGGYAFPAPSRYDDDSWDSDTICSHGRRGLTPLRWSRRTWCHSMLWMACLLYTSPSPRDLSTSRMPSSA